jgi:hypothetical protein
VETDVKRFPETPALDDGSEFSGHVWIQELPTGGPFRFRVAPSGLVTFATADGRFDAVESVPPPYRRGAELINADLGRAALQAATDEPERVTFCGLATRYEGSEYDWERLPAFVGTDVWKAETLLSPDRATGVFERLGLPTLPAVEKERPAAHADVGRFADAAELPPSAWCDGTAAGVLIRDKSGTRASVWRPMNEASPPAPTQQTPSELAATYATDERIERTVARLRDDGQKLTVDAIRDRIVADVAREAYATLYPDGEFVTSERAFESAVAERVQRHRSPT